MRVKFLETTTFLMDYCPIFGFIMQYSFQYEKPKVLQGLRVHFVSRPEVKVLAYAVNIFAIIAAVLFYMNKIRPQAFILCSLLWFVLMLTFWFIMPRMVYKRASKTFEDQYIATFNTVGVGIENENGSMSWEWPKFSNYFESGQFFHLYFGPRSFFLFPKTTMDADFIIKLRELLSKHVRKGRH